MLDELTQNLAGQVELVGVFTQPDRPAGRGQRATPNAIKTWALARSLPVLQPEKLDEHSNAALAAWAPDVSLVMAYGHLLRDAFIAIPRLETLNLHTSLLPRFRGASPIQTAVACGERETGVTLMRIVRALDAGPIADVEKVPIREDDTALDIEERLAAACVPLVRRSMVRLIKEGLSFVEQDARFATYCRRLSKEDGALDFNQPSEQVAARINGLFPWPACSVDLSGVSVKLGQAVARNRLPAVESEHDPRDAELIRRPGEVVMLGDRGLWVTCNPGFVCLKRLQRPGGRMLPTDEFLRGFRVSERWLIPSRPVAPLVSPSPFPPRIPNT